MMAIDETKLQALLDKQEIHERLTAFSRGMDRFDHASYSSAFWPDRGKIARETLN